MDRVETRRVDELTWRDDLYPRFEPDPVTIQRYAEDLGVLPPVEINQHNEIIDGYHRWTAHRKVKAETISVTVTPTKSEAELLALACERNSKHGLALTGEEKKAVALRLYADGTGKTETEIAKLLSVSDASVARYLSRRKKDLKEQRKQEASDLWLACWTYEEIGEKLGIAVGTAHEYIQEFSESDKCRKMKIFANYQDPDWKPPLYNIWKQREKSNPISHFGNSEPIFLDNLLYMYTEPYDIIVDPFAGSGSTIDTCKKRLRRYWVSDRLPIVERLDIRQADIAEGPPPLHKRWTEVALLYLDPPYWKQAEGEYSEDPEDLANMPLEDFYGALAAFVLACAEKMHSGAHIAMLIQPTQWKAPEHRTIDHVVDLIARIRGDKLKYERRIHCPYESQQANAHQVEWAKANRNVLEISRELVIWEVVDDTPSGKPREVSEM